MGNFGSIDEAKEISPLVDLNLAQKNGRTTLTFL